MKHLEKEGSSVYSQSMAFMPVWLGLLAVTIKWEDMYSNKLYLPKRVLEFC